MAGVGGVGAGGAAGGAAAAAATLRPQPTGRTGRPLEDNLILTPAKLRLNSGIFGVQITCLWLPNCMLAGLLLARVR